ncbi:uncharacterized protein LOC118450562 [Vespa mandarinia]|uniref:uncharacterized protein LOC118450562 n=1 Tax=Vespa mandarinia TaxID=7446 RepID=UPI0016141075|nr:uncharacterized protein LOC118450562 [Vespa mandarinia]XP_035742282.1 uncharacterized protein LOC118450562 [Vespa mandarinia]
MADAPSKSRPMKYPYTTAAQIAQFPYRHYFKHSWLLKYWMIAIVISAPLFMKIQKLSYSEGNVKVWNEKRKKEFEGHGH